MKNSLNYTVDTQYLKTDYILCIIILNFSVLPILPHVPYHVTYFSSMC